jgi:hypothetical protein
MTGQALVETALVLPVLLLLLLGIIGTGYLFHRQLIFQNGVDVLAQLAAGTGPRSDWHAAVVSENQRTGCHADPLEPTLTYPDGGKALPGRRLLATWACHLKTGWLFDGLPVTVSAEAVLERANPAAPEPSPSPRR